MINDLEDVVFGWREFFQEFFGLELENITLEKGTESARPLIIPRELTLKRVNEACRKNFPCYKLGKDMDKPMDRDPKDGTYVIWVREIETEVRGCESADKGVTPMEKMIWELKYFAETGKYPDISNRAIYLDLCSPDVSMPCSSYDAIDVIRAYKRNDNTQLPDSMFVNFCA